MIFGAVFEPFIKKCPVCVAARAVLERLMSPERMGELFNKTAVNGYAKELQFSTLVQLMGDVVLKVRPNVHAAFQALEQSGQMPVSRTAMYNKLNRIEPAVSAALVRDSAV